MEKKIENFRDSNNRDADDVAYVMIFHIQLLLNNFDELESYPTVFRHSLKQTGKKFKEELEKTTNIIFKNLDKQGTAKLALDPISDYYNILYEIDKLSVPERKLLSNGIVDLVSKLKLHKPLKVYVEE